MTKKRAFLVLGQEGSGTYMLWNALQAAGCHADSRHNGIHKDYMFERMESPFVMRRSFPHAGAWPEPGWIDYRMRDAGFKTHLLWIIREPNATFESIKRRNPDAHMGKWKRIQTQYLRELGAMHEYGSDIPAYTVITYEAFCLSEGFRRWLFEEELKLTYPADFEIKFGNEKNYG